MLKNGILARDGNGGGPRAPSHPCQEISSPKQSGSVSGCFCSKILIVIHYSKSNFNTVNEIYLSLEILYTTPETLILVNYWVLELEFQGRVSPQGNYSFLVEVGTIHY